MKSIYLLTTTLLLSSISAWSQQGQESLPTKNEENTITMNTASYVWAGPDLVTVQITISEYIHTDPETQATTAITLDKVKSTLYEKIKEIDVSKNDLEFISMTEGNNHYNYNTYNPGYQNYNTTQKKVLSASYNLQWTNSEDDLQKLYEALRFNGLTSVVLKCDYSETLQASIQEKLLTKCIVNAQRDAKISATVAGKKIGDLISITHNLSFQPNNIYTGGNIYYNNSLMKQKHECNATVSYELDD